MRRISVVVICLVCQHVVGRHSWSNSFPLGLPFDAFYFNSSKMHHPLHIPDIFLSILDQLEPSSTMSAEKDNRSLVNIAVVCRSWLEPALDRLWKRQHELLPLLKTLPSHKWNIDEYHSFVSTSVCLEQSKRLTVNE